MSLTKVTTDTISQKGIIGREFRVAEDGTFSLLLYSPANMRIISARYVTGSGMITAKIQTQSGASTWEDTTGLTAMSVSTTAGTSTAAEAGTSTSHTNYVAAGEGIRVVTSSNSSAELFRLELLCETL